MCLRCSVWLCAFPFVSEKPVRGGRGEKEGQDPPSSSGERPPRALVRLCVGLVLSGRGWPWKVSRETHGFPVGSFERPGFRGDRLQGLPCPRMLRMPLEENLPVAADPPARSPACWSSGFPVCSSHASSLGGRGSSGFWVRPALSEKVSFSSYLPERVRASYGLEGSLPNGPLEGSP